jgi:hypothetical protein
VTASPDGSDAAPAKSRGPRPFEPSLPAMGRSRLLLAVGVLGAAGCTTLVTHYGAWSWPLQQTMRDWALHSCGVLATTLTLGLVLGLYRAHRHSFRTQLMRIAVGVPLTITLLHEVGQWIWPHSARDAFDSIRDCVLNIAGAMTAAFLLRAQRPSAGGGAGVG